MGQTRCDCCPNEFWGQTSHAPFIQMIWDQFVYHIGGHALAHGRRTKIPPVLPVTQSDDRTSAGHESSDLFILRSTKIWWRMAIILARKWAYARCSIVTQTETRTVWNSFEFEGCSEMPWTWCCFNVLKEVLKQWTRIWVWQCPSLAAADQCTVLRLLRSKWAEQPRRDQASLKRAVITQDQYILISIDIWYIYIDNV